MKNIIINPNHCSNEECQELKDYLTEKAWDWKEASSGEMPLPDGHKVTEVLLHNIEWWSEGFEGDDLPEVNKEHIHYLIEEGCREGELILKSPYGPQGWWKIKA